MDDSEENMSTEDVRSVDSPFSVKSKPKKRSLVERELETNLTARVTSPVTGEGTNTSRYGRARRLKTVNDLDTEKVIKPLRIDTVTQPQAYKMHASNSPIRQKSPKRAMSVASSIENQIENIYNENMSLSRFGSTDEAKSQSPAKKFTKVYIRKDLIQKPDTDTVVLIKNMFSPLNKSSHVNNILERSSEKYSLNGHGKRNGFLDTSSVVKTLDFDGKKKKKDLNETKEKTVAKNELFELEAGCDYQVGNLAWARVGTYPFWPCIVTREPFTDMFVKKKLFGRVEHDVIHVTFFGDNGRRGWIVDNMLRKFHGRPEFEGARAKFTPEAKKKDPRFYAAHFVSEKKLPLWNVSVDEAETLMREPKRFRIDLLHELVEKARATKTTPKREKSSKITRTDSDVSLSESLYDTLFSEDDAKTDDSKCIKKSRNKSLDVSEVVTACLDNMAAKTGIIQIQKQSHMDRWLQKAKSKTPEKTQPKLLVKTEREKRKDKSKKKQKETRKPKPNRNESLSSEKNLLPYQNEHDYSSVNYENHDINDSSNINTDFEESGYEDKVNSNNIEVVAEVESFPNKTEDCSQDDIITTIVSDEIDMNDVENVTKVENFEVAHDIPEPPKENVRDSNVINKESSISSIETEQEESKEETLTGSDVLSNVGLQPRRSKRKRQSDVEKSKSVVENKTDSSNINADFEESELDAKVERNNIEVTGKVQSLSNNAQDCSQDDIATTVVGDDIVINDVENVIKVENSEFFNDTHEPANEIGQDSNTTNVKRSISSNKTEQIELKVESLQNDVFSNIGLQPRRRKRKRQSDTEKNKSVSENKKGHDTEESKLRSNYQIAKSESEATVGDHNIVNSNTDNSNTDHQEHILDTDKKYATEQDVDKATKEDRPVSEAHKETSKQNKVHNLFLNGPRPVVVIEQLKIDDFQSLIIAKAAKQRKDAELCKLQKDDDTVNETGVEKPKVDDINVSKDFSALKIIDSDILKPIADSSLGTAVNESSSKNAIVKDANIDTKEIGNVKSQDETLVVPNKKALNGKSHNDAVNLIETVKMDVDETDFYHSNEKDQTENAESKSRSRDSDSSLPLSNLAIETNDVVEPLRTDVANLPPNEDTSKNSDKLNVVIGEETYVFDRTLSQDFDEIDPDKGEEVNRLATYSNNDSGCEFDVSKNARTVSPIYDDIDMEKDEIKIEESAEKSESNFVKDDQNEPAHEIDTEAVVNGVPGKGQVFCKASVHKSKEKVEKGLISPSQLIGDEMLNGYTNNVSDEIIDVASRKTDQKELETSNVVMTKKNKKEKRSPKLSLNKLKNHISNERPNDVKNTESPKFILDNNAVQDKVVSIKALKDDTNDVQIDTFDPLDFEMLIDMERTKAQIPKINGLVESKDSSNKKVKEEDADVASIKSEDSGASITRRKIRSKEKLGMDDPEFIKYLELRHDALIDEQPELSELSSDEIVTYFYQTWLYEENNKSDRKKTDDAEQSNLVKGLNQDPPPPRKYKKKPKVEKETNVDISDLVPKDKPKRKATQSKPYYNEEFSDFEEEDLETFSIFDKDTIAQNEDGEEIDEVELYFEKLTKPKPNVFKGYVREKVCEICEQTGNLVKCKSCHGAFHPDCTMKEEQIVEIPAPTRGRKKKKKPRGRKPKSYDESLLDSESQSDEKSQDANLSEELNASLEDEESHITVDAANFEAQLELKMKEMQLEQADEFESDQEIIWDAPPGQCEIVGVKPKEKPIDYSDFKCQNCEKYDTPICFVCKSNKSPKTLSESRQKCQVAHCHRYYHLECLEYWPQTQFNSWEPSKTNKKIIEYVEALSCPRHVCHTCVSDDPRGCKTRFCGDKLARCVKCPATYHSFTKCLPAGTQILTGSQIICPRHYEHRAGKVPCHVNTGWCFICALGGTLICCEYCPTSFHAECLNIKPPEGSYMCEDCETGRLPLYGEMVWVKLGHYRWWPGIVLHPTEIPDNILAVKHFPGEFVVRFFGQYDHYWVNRGRVFPFQEGDSGKISSQKSKIDAAFTTAMEHAQRACEILKNVEPNEEEDMDIASSLLPPHYVKLKVNKPVGSLTGRRDVDANSLTQCDCDPAQPDPCGPYSHCLNRMLLTECGPLCRAGELCNNRAFERRRYPRLAAYRTPQRGWGLKTLDDIRQGQFVIEYVGELIDEDEFRRRMARKHEIRDENFYFLTLDKERMIDAGPKGNLARFMNHCCEPNCETQKWTVLGDVRVGLFALRDIAANSEVTFNYNLECAGIEKKRCLCGAKRCSGYIGAKPKQEEAQPKKQKGPGKRTYKKRKHVEDSPSTSKIKPPIKIKIKPIKPRELTEIEKDLLIIKNATNGMSSDSDSRLSSVDEKKDTKALKRKRVSFSTDEVSVKKVKREDSEVD